MATALDPVKSAPTKQDAFVEQTLAQARGRIRMLDLAAAGLGLAALVCGYAVAVILLDRWLQLPDVARQAGLVLFVVGTLAYLYLAILRPLRRSINPYYAARQVEQTVPEAKNSLINWLDLREQQIPGSIRNALGARAAKDLKKADLNEAIQGRSVLGIGIMAGIMFAALVAALLILRPTQFFSLFERAFAPFSFTSIATRTQINIEVPQGGDVTVPVNQAVTIEVNVDGRVPGPNQPDSMRLLFRYNPNDSAYEEQALEPGRDSRHWVTRVPGYRVQNGFWYKVAGGDAETPEYHVQVHTPPLVTGFKVTYTYRPYLRWKADVTSDPNLEAFRGTQVEMVVSTNRPVKSGELKIEGAEFTPAAQKLPDRPEAMLFRFELEKSCTYRVQFTAEDGEQNRDAFPYKIKVLTDQVPTVEITKPAEETTLPANDTLKVEGTAADDFGIDHMGLFMQVVREVGSKPLPVKMKPYRPMAGGKAKSFRREDGTYPRKLDYKDFVELEKLELVTGEPAGLAEGMVLEYWLEAVDNCDYPKANTGKSKVQRVKIAPPAKDEEQKQQQQDKRDEAKEQQQKHEQQQDDKHKNEKRESNQPQRQDAKPEENKPGEKGENDPNKEGKPNPNKKGGEKDKPEQGKPENGSEGGANDTKQPNPGENNPDQKSEDQKRQERARDLEKQLDNLNKEKGDQKPERGENKPDKNPPQEGKPEQKSEPKGGGEQKPDAQNKPSEQKGDGEKQGNAPSGEKKPEGGLEKPPPKSEQKGQGDQNPGAGQSEPKNNKPQEGSDEAKPKPMGKPDGERNQGDNPMGSGNPMKPDGDPKSDKPNNQSGKPGEPKGNGSQPKPDDKANPEGGGANDSAAPKSDNREGKPKPDAAPQRAEKKDAGEQGTGGDKTESAEAKPEKQQPRADAKPNPQQGNPGNDARAGDKKEPGKDDASAKAGANKPDAKPDGTPPPKEGDRTAKSEPKGSGDPTKPDRSTEQANNTPGDKGEPAPNKEAIDKLAKDLQSSDPKTRAEAERKLDEMAKNAADARDRKGAQNELNNDLARKEPEHADKKEGGKPGQEGPRASEKGPQTQPNADRSTAKEPGKNDPNGGGEKSKEPPAGTAKAEKRPGGDPGTSKESASKPEEKSTTKPEGAGDARAENAAKPMGDKPPTDPATAKAGKPETGEPGMPPKPEKPPESPATAKEGPSGDPTASAKTERSENVPPGSSGDGAPSGAERPNTPVAGNATASQDVPEPANPEHQRRAGELQLKKFKDAVEKDPDLAKKLNMSKEELADFMKGLEEMNKRRAADSAAATKDDRAGGAGGSHLNTGAKRVESKPGTGPNGQQAGPALAPPEYRDAYKQLTEELSRPAPKK